MELSAVITLRDKLSAQMDKASKSVSAMTKRVNESKEAISKISATQNINISAKSNISEIVSAAKTSIASLQNTISQKELSLQTKIDMDGFENETINAKLTEFGTFLEKNGGKVEEYSNKLAILKQKQSEFTSSTKGSVKLGVEQSIGDLEKKLADIEAAKQQFAEWQQIRIDFNELEVARAELSTMERALENISNTNVAVRAYLDFKTDALKQVYDIDDKLKSIGQKVIKPIVDLKDKATEKINSIKTKTKTFAREKFAPIISAIDKTKPIMSAVQSKLAKIAGTVAYPVVKAKDFASDKIQPLYEKLRELGNKVFTPKIKLKKEEIKKDLNDLCQQLANFGAKTGKAVAGATAKITKGLMVSVGAASINVGSQFEASMSQVAATMGMTAEEANYSNEAYAKLANVAKEMGASTKFSASEAGEALNYLALAGYDADKACGALPTILNLAAAGGMDLAAASDMVTDSMSALGIAATGENLTQFGDQLAKTAQKSNTSVAQLGEAILTVGGTAKTLAGGTTEMNALLGILADNGDKGAEGGTKLRNVMLSLQAPTDAAAKKLNSLGVSVYDAQGKMRPMNEVLGDLNASMGDMTDAAKQDTLSTIFNKADLKSVTSLLSGTVAEVSDISTLLSEKYQLNLEKGDLDAFSEMLKKSNGDLKVTDSLMKDFGLSSETASDVVKDLQKSIPRFDLLSGLIEDSNNAMEDMAETMNDNLQGRIIEFKSAMDTAGIAIYEALGSSNLKDLVKEASGWIGELTKATEEGGIDGLVGAIGSVFAKIVTKISSTAPQIIQAGVGIVSNLISGIKNNLPQIASGLAETGTVFVQGILQLVPELLLAGGDLILELSKGVIKQLPELLHSGTEAITKLAQGIVDGTPLMADVVVEIITALSSSMGQNLQPILGVALHILTALVDGIVQVLPVLIPAVIQIIAGFVQFISANLGTIIMVALDILMALVQGIIDSIPVLIPAVVEVIQNIVQFVSDNLPMILEAALNIILALIQGITENIPMLVDGVIEIITSFVTFIVENLPLIISGAIHIVTALVSGLIQAIPNLITGALQLVQAIWNTITNTNWLQLGIDMVKGIGNGLLNGVKEIGSTIKDAAGSIVNKFKGFLGIHSPSTVMEAEVGLNIGAGVAEGLKKTKQMVSQEVGNLTNDMTMTFEAGVANVQPIITDPYSQLELEEKQEKIPLSLLKQKDVKLESVFFPDKMETAIEPEISSLLKIPNPQLIFDISFDMEKSLKEIEAALGQEKEKLDDGMILPLKAELKSVKFANIDTLLPESEELKSPKKSNSYSNENWKENYKNLEVAQPVNTSNVNSFYSETTENRKQNIKKYYIEKIIENVTITGEGDEDRLAEKILAILADEIEETAENMGEEDFA